MTRAVWSITGLILAAIASFIFWGSAHAQDYTLLGGVVPTPTPTPVQLVR